MEAIEVAVSALDELDPILGYDILFSRGDKGMLQWIYNQCLERADVHPQGILRNKWNTVLDALQEVT